MGARTERRERLPRHEFTLVIEGADVLEPGNLDAWFEAGCDDATFGEVDSVGFADFAREASSGPQAILSAIQQIESAVPTVRVIRVEPDDLVNASDIAARLGRSRESVRLLIAGERGPGGFPAPVSHLKVRGRLWRWAEVARWVRLALRTEHPDTDAAIFVAALNDALDLRRLTSALVPGDLLEPLVELLPTRLDGTRLPRSSDPSKDRP
jgi:hypothetical protein